MEANANSMVTLQVEPHQDNTNIGPLCYLSELTDQCNSIMRNQRTAELDLTKLNSSNPMAGLYFGDIRFVTLDECLNPSSDNLNNPLQGCYAQFECFECKFYMTYLNNKQGFMLICFYRSIRFKASRPPSWLFK